MHLDDEEDFTSSFENVNEEILTYVLYICLDINIVIIMYSYILLSHPHDCVKILILFCVGIKLGCQFLKYLQKNIQHMP